MAVKIPAILALRAEFDALAPNRDKGADGIGGDAAHMAKSSDHNPDDTPGSRTPHSDDDTIAEYHALDIDSSGPWPAGMTMAAAVAYLLDKFDQMGSRCPVSYVIWDRHIYQGVYGWQKDSYGGADPHTNHAHFSFKYGSGSGSSNPENYAGPYGLEERFAVLNADDKKWISAEIGKQLDQLVTDVLTAKIGDKANAARTVADVLRDTAKLRGVLIGDPKDTENAKLDPHSPLQRMIDLATPPPAEKA